MATSGPRAPVPGAASVDIPLDQTVKGGLPDAHAAAARQVAELLAVDPAIGLSQTEVDRRAIRSGPNALEPADHTPVWRMILGAASEPFMVLLVVAGLLAIAVGEARDGVLILIALLPIVGADVVTEYRCERALEALREATAPTAHVRREGRVSTVQAASLVPGDVVLIQGGDVAPADLRLTNVERLLIDRSTLTGESIPEPARSEPDAAGVPLAERRAIAYAGTSVVGGRGEGLVVAIGPFTEVGRIAGALSSRERRRSPLQHELDRLARFLLVVAVGLIAITVGSGFLRGHPLGENVLAGISAAIAAIPEEPPVLLAVILGLGAYRLLRRGVLVRRLNAQETLGAVDLVLTDKTGTLTQNRLAVSSVRTPEGSVDAPAALRAVLVDAYRAEEDAWPGAVAPGAFTRALKAAVDAAGVPVSLDATDLIEAVPATDERPFSSTVAHRDERIEHLALGAPEVVLGQAAGEPTGRAAWERLIDTSADAGERLLALASSTDGSDWRMRALIGFADPIRPNIGQAMETARGAGIQVVIVTGDHPRTAAAIARQAGLGDAAVVTGDQLAGWGPDRLTAELGRLHIVARSTPEQKRRLVDAARRAGRTVAVTGDGVNDAPALHRADVAVAMGSGTAVAREAADLVLGDDSFATLMYGLAEGRRIVDNVQKGLVFLLSTHMAFLGFILLATIFAGSAGQPLLPIQILWMELFIDLTASTAFEREPPEPDLMERSPRHPGQPLLTQGLLLRIALAGSVTALAALVLFLSGNGGFDHARWLAYTTLVVSQCVRAYADRSIGQPIHRLGPNLLLGLTAIGAVVIQFAIPYVPAVAGAFRAVVLSPGDWLLVLAVALLPAVAAESIRTLRPGIWVA
jgi:P-type Ca2+ transporter type 2C